MLVVYNPVSGAKQWKSGPEKIKRLLKKQGAEVTWFETQARAHQDFSSVEGQRFDRVLICGGDGTIAEVVTWMLKTGLKSPIALLPQGSANVLATSLGLRFVTLEGALKNAITGSAKPLDVMHVNRSRMALIAVGRGYDAFLMKETHRHSKRRWGPLAYFWTFLKTFLVYRSKPYILTIDGQRHYLTAKVIVAVNVAPVPEILLSSRDGKVTVFAMGRRFRLQAWTGQRIDIKAKEEITFQLDGEVFKNKTVSIEVLLRAVEMVH